MVEKSKFYHYAMSALSINLFLFLWACNTAIVLYDSITRVPPVYVYTEVPKPVLAETPSAIVIDGPAVISIQVKIDPSHRKIELINAKAAAVPAPTEPSNTPSPDNGPDGSGGVDPLEQFEVVSVLNYGDTSVFNNVALMLIANVVLMVVLLGSSDFNLRTNYDFVIRSLYQLVRSMVKENLYIQKQQYFSVLFYLFLTILFANLVGLLPFSFTVTSSFVLTFFLSLTYFLGVNLIGANRHEWQLNDLFLPSGAPLAIAPFLIFIEAVSYIARVLSLSIRLFANMMSGHALLKILIGFSWTLLCSGSLMILLSIFPWVIVTAVMFLELLIAFLQAYVFTILITLYINDVLTFHD